MTAAPLHVSSIYTAPNGHEYSSWDARGHEGSYVVEPDGWPVAWFQTEADAEAFAAKRNGVAA